ncbi:N-acetylmuramoyl-L-alanine amidase [Lutibaculum baratangense]|uniref:N-acetylmuramoyl-L-alanine amidase n=1 Tax=Lutibaculum baratangense AMV1 TaxID=631454 RepID=V4R5W2_9HYPH|nr:N-acetylmuramoyl-L-alanine amidase [Lutibaculum baratangense]ESR27342.1 N-acetylmuramoyl-L-alanine amidase [Lutibaculum baratangense AMV1]
MTFTDAPSPNHDERGGCPVDILLLHYTGMPDAEDAVARLRDPVAKVSSHWFVHEDGRVLRLVPEERRAWHAGVAFWAGARDINARSVGIEIQNPGHEWGYRSFPDVQIAAVIDLCREILERHPIPPERVLAHSDVAPARKEDPGELFPWRLMGEAGVGLWCEPCPAEGEGRRPLASGEAEALRAGLVRLGYEPKRAAEAPVISAFQRHWRPERCDGIADLSTLLTLERLLQHLR